jgi:hypothetical protein
MNALGIMQLLFIDLELSNANSSANQHLTAILSPACRLWWVLNERAKNTSYRIRCHSEVLSDVDGDMARKAMCSVTLSSSSESIRSSSLVVSIRKQWLTAYATSYGANHPITQSDRRSTYDAGVGIYRVAVRTNDLLLFQLRPQFDPMPFHQSDHYCCGCVHPHIRSSWSDSFQPIVYQRTSEGWLTRASRSLSATNCTQWLKSECGSENQCSTGPPLPPRAFDLQVKQSKILQ